MDSRIGILLFNLSGKQTNARIKLEFDGELKIIEHLVVDLVGSEIASTIALLPDEYVLNNAYPNPFNPTATISYGLPQDSFVRLVVYDLMGREVTTLFNQTQHAGYHQYIWNASQYASGIYFVQIISGDSDVGPQFIKTQKLMLVK